MPQLGVEGRERIDAPLEGRLAGLAILGPTDEASRGQGRVLAVTDRFGVYLLDGSMSRVARRVVLDPLFSVELTPLAGTAFLGPDTLAVMSTNKSYVLLAPDSAADEEQEWRRFYEMDDSVVELARSRFQTVRAHLMYSLSLAYDPVARELVTVTVPSPGHEELVVSRFARKDLVLSSEFEPELGPGLSLRGEDRSLGEYYVTGAVVADGRLYALSAAYSTLLVVDLDSKRLTAAYAVSGIQEPVGLAMRDGRLLVAEAGGRVAMLELPSGETASGP